MCGKQKIGRTVAKHLIEMFGLKEMTAHLGK